MNKCQLCPRKCGVDRSENKGYCGRTGEITVARSSLHIWEEPPISGANGSGAVFFTGCSLRCAFCQNHDISIGDNHGKSYSAAQLSQLFFELVEKGAHNINLVTPTHYADKIAEALSCKKLPVPAVTIAAATRALILSERWRDWRISICLISNIPKPSWLQNCQMRRIILKSALPRLKKCCGSSLQISWMADLWKKA